MNEKPTTSAASKAFDEHSGEAANVEIVKWEFSEANPVNFGWLKSVTDLPTEDGMGTYKRFVFDTGNGLFSVAGGRMLEDALVASAKIGDLCRLEFCGKESIRGGRNLNVWDVRVVSALSK